MHPKMATAINLLGIDAITIYDGKKFTTVSAKDHIKALCSYFNLAGYLSPALIHKAVTYLHLSKPFQVDKEKVIEDLIRACNVSNLDGNFNAEIFISNFAKESYFEIEDIIDLICFLQQTAFDRDFGAERSNLQTKSWMITPEFFELAKNLGVISSMPPMNASYFAAGLMGGASSRVEKRLQHLKELTVKINELWALSGNRELSKDLDDMEVMLKVAKAIEKEIKFQTKTIGAISREFLSGVSETMMVNFLIKEICPYIPMEILESSKEPRHWRATTAQNAIDIVPKIIQKIETDLKENPSNTYTFLVISNQPFVSRMTRQLQREFNKQSLKKNILVKVEGTGPAVTMEEIIKDNKLAAQINSELGSLMAERYTDARLMLQQDCKKELRDPKIIMYSTREAEYLKYVEIMNETNRNISASNNP